MAAEASLALPARSHGGHHHLLADPLFCAFTCFDDGAAHLVAQGERKAVPGGNSTVIEAEIGMANPAAGYLDEGFLRPWPLIPFLQDHRLPARVNRPC
jgi:hypothetical protein